MLSLEISKFPELETPRLLLRAPGPDDAVAVLALRSNTEAMKYMVRPPAVTLQDAETHINVILEGFEARKNINFGITLKEDPSKIIGFIGYPRINFENHRGEVGYILHPGHWHKGIASEALKAVLDFGFSIMKLHTVFANIDPANSASRQLLLAHGFVKEAFFKEDLYYEGRFLDSEIYGKVTNIK